MSHWPTEVWLVPLFVVPHVPMRRLGEAQGVPGSNYGGGGPTSHNRSTSVLVEESMAGTTVANQEGVQMRLAGQTS